MSEKIGNQSAPTAAVIGAGVGGIATAARLAKAGFQVTVFEKNDYTGGRCSLLHSNGHRFDQGPSLLLLPEIFHEIFTDLDTSITEAGVQLVKCEPNYKVWFDDGECLQLSTDLTKMKSEVEKWEGAHGFDRYLGFLRESHWHYESSVEHVLKRNFTSLFSLLRPSFLGRVPSLHILESVWTRASVYFKSERLRRAFTFASMYMGMSPFDAPGVYSLLQYTELAEGIWYPIGGFHAIIQALSNTSQAQNLPITYRLSTPVQRIELSKDGRQAIGVRLVDQGEHRVFRADVVVCNADLVYAYQELLPKSRRGEKLKKRDTSCSSINFYWSLDRVVPQLGVHNIFLASAYRESFDEIFKEFSIPSDPSFYINVPSRVDASAAPSGRDSVVVLVPIGHLIQEDESERDAEKWKKLVDQTREKVFTVLQARLGLQEMRNWIIDEMVNTPVTWQERFNLDRGAILGLSHSFFNVLSFRPKTRHPEIGKCFFVGASTHPGTGVPICLAGAKLTATQVLEDFGMPVPWAAKSAAPYKAGVTAIDKTGLDKKASWGWSYWVWALLVFVVVREYANA